MVELRHGAEERNVRACVAQLYCNNNTSRSTGHAVAVTDSEHNAVNEVARDVRGLILWERKKSIPYPVAGDRDSGRARWFS